MEQKRPKLLIIDGDVENRETMARRLERKGYAVAAVPCERTAIELCPIQDTDLVLLDHDAPAGAELLREIRARRGPEDLPVVIMIAATETTDVVAALNLGANDYLTKPVDFAVALARIRSQLSRRSTERDIRERDRRDALAARGSNDGLWDWNLESNEMYYSPRWKSMLGYDESAIESSPAEWFSRIHPEDSNRVQHDLEAAISGVSEIFENQHRLQHKDGGWRWVSSRGKAFRDKQGRPLRLAGTQTDVTESKIADPLTNLPNRLSFGERIASALTRSGREPGYGFAVLLLNIDRFKVINDSLGHLVGDELLVGLARRFRDIDQRFRCTLARFGGDEFAILIDEASSPSDAVSVASWVQQALARPFPLEGREVFCSISIGIALGPADAGTVEEVLLDAETAMHRAKALGGGRFEIFDNEMRKRAVARMELESDLRRALERGDFEVYYQPKVWLDDGHITGFEALVRWNHRRRGLVLPAEFISVAEETGLIIPLGKWVLSQACRQLRAWQDEFPRSPTLTMSVNVSWKQFRDPGLCADIRSALVESGLNPATLRLELTESVLMDDTATATRVLDELKEIGVGLKMDDFGTGYSSLRYLCRMPFDTLKIDQCFVQELAAGREGAEIIKSVISLAAGLGLSVVAEGVETRLQAERLRALGCHFGQGFYFSRAVDAHAASDLLTNDSQNMHRDEIASRVTQEQPESLLLSTG